MSESIREEIELAEAKMGKFIEVQADKLVQVLPAHIGPERFIRWSLAVVRKGVSGRHADKWAELLVTAKGQLSVMHALLDCASLGLEPGRTYHLVPYGGEVVGIVDYTGEIELIYRAGDYPVVAELVFHEDNFVPRGGNRPPHHEAPGGNWFADRGPVVGGYAYCEFPGGDAYSKLVTMSEIDFAKHREKARTTSVWDEWPEAMRLKTLVHQLRKWVPWSADIRKPAPIPPYVADWPASRTMLPEGE